MLKRLLIILLLTPMALPATTGVCQMMMNRLSHLTTGQPESEMNCCPTDGSGHCAMAETRTQLTEAQPISDPVSPAVCECGMSDSSLPSALLTERLTVSSLRLSPDVLPAVTGLDEHFQPLSAPRGALPVSVPSPHLQQTCLRI
jgi:hypothetical protein